MRVILWIALCVCLSVGAYEYLYGVSLDVLSDYIGSGPWTKVGAVAASIVGFSFIAGFVVNGIWAPTSWKLVRPIVAANDALVGPAGAIAGMIRYTPRNVLQYQEQLSDEAVAIMQVGIYVVAFFAMRVGIPDAAWYWAWFAALLTFGVQTLVALRVFERRPNLRHI